MTQLCYAFNYFIYNNDSLIFQFPIEFYREFKFQPQTTMFYVRRR